MNNFSTVAQMLANRYAAVPERRHLTYKKDGAWETKTYGESITDVIALAESLRAKGYSGRHIMLYGENSYEWIVSDLAIIGYVGVCVAADPFWRFDDMKNAVSFTDVSAVLYTEKNIDVVSELRAEFPGVDFLSLSRDIPALIQSGREMLAGKADIFTIEARPADLMCKLLFTSGTSGLPKAAMLTQRNLFALKNGIDYALGLTESDSSFLFLPLRHVIAFIHIEIYMTTIGMEIIICSDKNRLFEEIAETNPTTLIAVPLIYDRLCAAR